MAQDSNFVNRVSGRQLIADENHMGEILERLQRAQEGAGQAEQSQPRTIQQQAGDQQRSQQRGERTRQAY